MTKTRTPFRAIGPRLFLLILMAVALTAPKAAAQTVPTWAGVQRSSGTGSFAFAGGRSIAVAADGSQYVAGTFSGTLTLGTVVLTASSGAGHVFLVKYSAAGVVLWATKLDNVQSLLTGRVAVDAAGNAYLAGFFAGTVTLGSTTLTSGSLYTSAYLAKFDAQGLPRWVQQSSGASNVDIGAVATDAAGNVAITGGCGAGASFGGTAVAGNGHFFYKFSPAGAVLQATLIGPSGFVNAMAFDGAGNAYLAGQFITPTTFGTIPLTPLGSFDIFVCKLDPAGNALWAVRDGGTGPDQANAITLDPAGNPVVCGTTDPGTSSGVDAKLYLARFSTQGTRLWARTVAPSVVSNHSANGVAYDGRGGYFVVGQFRGTAVFGSSTLTAVGPQLFVARYDGQGNAVWADRTAGANTSSGTTGTAVAVDAAGNAFLTGNVAGTVAFGTQSTTSAAAADAFVAQLTAGSVLTASRPATAGLALAAYPNPATGSATLLLPAGGGHLVFLDALGRSVRAQALPATAGPCPVALAGLAPGCYQLRATLGTGQVARATLQVR